MGLWKEKMKEVMTSIIPIIIVVIILQALILDTSLEDIGMFALCVVFVIIGFTMFLCGVELGINPIGNAIGTEIPKRKSRLFMIVVVFAISFLVTVAEPDVSVFATQVNSLFTSIDRNTLVYSIAAGVAALLIVAAFKIIYKLSLKLILTISYAAVIILTLVLSASGNLEFLGIAFDSGGVTTGPVTVPILLALGIGICSVGMSHNEMDGFGMIGLASVGPIIALLVMGLLTGSSDSVSAGGSSGESLGLGFELLLTEFKNSTYSVVIALVPLSVFFVFFQRVFLRYSWNAVTNMLEGTVLAGIGIIIFLTGVYSGFMPVAMDLGEMMATMDPSIVIAVGFILGFLVAFAEPAVGILGDQVEESSDGILKKHVIILVIAIGVASLVALGMAKLMFNLNFVYIIVPGYIIALALMWMSDKDLVGIAFDAGGVSTGPMSVAILSSLYIGMASVLYVGRDAVINGFGLIALIALAPCMFLSALGVIMKYKKKGAAETNGE